ncbi:DNA polymerase epsilon subunit C [Trichoderma longibrachiatum]
MAEDSPYAPRSPDLSSFLSGSPTQAEHLQHGQAGYKVQPPTNDLPSTASSLYIPPPYGAHHQQPPTPTSQPVYEQYFPPVLRQPAHSFDAQNAAPPVPYRLEQRVFRQPPRPSARYDPYHNPNHDHAHAQGHAQVHTSGQPSTSSADMPPRKAVVPPPPAPAIEPSPVRTKFPTARIKRIMQADEEVGKVAQQTPIAVGKALELFMIQLVTKSADVAKDKGSKRVTASMLKQVVEADEQWDFLRDIVGRVENEKEGSKAKAKDSETDEEMEEPKKRGRGGRRKKVQ